MCWLSFWIYQGFTVSYSLDMGRRWPLLALELSVEAARAPRETL